MANREYPRKYRCYCCKTEISEMELQASRGARGAALVTEGDPACETIDEIVVAHFNLIKLDGSQECFDDEDDVIVCLSCIQKVVGPLDN